MSFLIVLVAGMPLVAALVTAVLGPRVLREASHVPTVTATAISFIGSLALLGMLLRATPAAHDAHSEEHVRTFERVFELWTWADISPSGASIERPVPHGTWDFVRFHIPIALRVDPLTVFMLVTVTFISLLVAIYSIGYMHDDPGYWRFYTYISLFVFSMIMLVSVSNFVLLYVFWEAVGLCSYLLIGFWYRKPEAAAAGKKAFLVNRVGDFGFALGIFLLWSMYGTLNFHDTIDPQTQEVFSAGILGTARLLHPEKGLIHGGLATVACLLLFAGACGKSAQFPLHVWLPDAMEGPTPVSALIHAATMVTAGVYMVARCMPLFQVAPHVLEIVGGVATFTALMAAVIALTQTDLKRILAYSTISQLGYMFLGLSVGGLVGAAAAMFHLFTHAFFKALLFLGAGSVMHATGGVIDLNQIGGLRRRLPWTHVTFLIGSLALAGIFPLAGFFSKDEILLAVAGKAPHSGYYQTLLAIAMATAFLTAVYTFRAYFRTFFGEERLPAESVGHVHESPPVMLIPLGILAAGSVVVGALLGPTRWVEHFLSGTTSLDAAAHLAGHGMVAHAGAIPWISLVLALLGVALAAGVVLGPGVFVQGIVAAFRAVGLYTLSYRKFFFDEIYQWFIVRPLAGLASVAAWIDRFVIDWLVDVVGLIPRFLGAMLRSVQNGLIPWYALGMVLGMLVLLAALVL
ncbi:NADH-quinone oxidoreductase subunit L [Thermogutta sp.]|uniref:NADH-quinone oxidoreductase subunit L n=1 Tax=Thermogutta sp. TaxID=1962930 RepID=UPI0032200E3A